MIDGDDASGDGGQYNSSSCSLSARYVPNRQSVSPDTASAVLSRRSLPIALQSSQRVYTTIDMQRASPLTA
jgi:hypothetical protein